MADPRPDTATRQARITIHPLCSCPTCGARPRRSTWFGDTGDSINGTHTIDLEHRPGCPHATTSLDVHEWLEG